MSPSFKIHQRLPSGHCIVQIKQADDPDENGMYAILKPNGWLDACRFETVTDACIILDGMIPVKPQAEDELSQFEQKVLIDALRKAIKDPLSIASINEVRENLIDRINNGEITIAKLF